MEFEEVNGNRRIYRTYNDTEVSELAVNVECPHCGNQFQEYGKSDCGETYEIECDEVLDNGCGKTFEMYFDAS